MGASRGSLLKIFMTVGLSIGLVGVSDRRADWDSLPVLPPGRGEFHPARDRAKSWDPSVRFLTELPSRTDPVEVTAIVAVTILLTFFATLFPARNAANTDPVQVLRYE